MYHGSVIHLSHLCKSYGDKAVLSDVTLSLAAQKTHVLIGASGSGKSTLLRLVLGLISADSGEIKIGELSVSTTTQAEVATKVGYVVQDGGLFPHLSAADNITLAARARGAHRQTCEARLKELAELARLDSELLKRFPSELSGGQRQRVGLLRAMMLDPQVYVLDEPLGALDPLVRAELQNELKRIFDYLKKTVVLVTHDLAEAAFFGHTITLLQDGKVAQNGTFEDLVRHPASLYVTEFIRAVRPPAVFKEIL